MNFQYDNHHNIDCLQPFHYQGIIKLFLILLCIEIFIYIPYFCYIKLPAQYQIAQQLQVAEMYFKNQDYTMAIDSFEKILQKIPKFKHGKIRIAQSYFALSAYYIDIEYEEDAYYMFYTGYQYLKCIEFKQEEIKDLKKYIHNDYIDTFNHIFSIKS